MLPFDVDCPPSLAEVMLTGRATRAGVAATLVRLASQGWVVVREGGPDGYEVQQRLPMPSVSVPADTCDRMLLRWLSDVRPGQDGPDARRSWWTQWLASVEQQWCATGVPTAQSWRLLQRLRGLPPLARRLVPRERAERWRAIAERLKWYPTVTDPLPETRQEWDTAFGYAVALGESGSFLRHAREVCEYYERNFEGIVVTFFTPRWYVYRRVDGEARFAFLTEGLGEFIRRFHWRMMKPEEVELARAANPSQTPGDPSLGRWGMGSPTNREIGMLPPPARGAGKHPAWRGGAP